MPPKAPFDGDGRMYTSSLLSKSFMRVLSAKMLPDVSSLAGTVVTDGGRLLVFSIITNGPMSAGAWPVRVAIDNTVAALAALPAT